MSAVEPTELWSPEVVAATETLQIIIDGVVIRAHKSNGRVFWCSDWARVWDLPLGREYGGPGTYGHVDFVVPR